MMTVELLARLIVAEMLLGGEIAPGCIAYTGSVEAQTRWLVSRPSHLR